MDLNVLVRGQSNALLFADRGGAWALEPGLEARLGVDVHLLFQWGTDNSTIHSATAFMSWDTDGQQASLLRYLHALPADLKDNPTATLWMHNEYDQDNPGLTEDAWLGEVRADAAMVRDALGQGVETTPYIFVPIRYPYGGNLGAITDGMATLDADPSFNAEISWAAQSLAMDGDGYAGSNHMGDDDAVRLGEALVGSMAETLRPLAGGSSLPPPSEEQPAVTLSAGSGRDALVLKLSQDAYRGDAQYTASVDGQQVGGVFTASSRHGSGGSDTLTLSGDWGPGAHQVSITFLNDAWDGTPDTDRNLHVDGIAYNGAAIGDGEADLMSAGTVTFGFTDTDGTDPAPSAPAAAGIDWNALAAQALANFNATGHWFV